MFKDLVLKNRTYRRFYQDERMSTETLKELVDLARHSSSGMNMQPLKYIIVNGEEKADKVFQYLKFAGYLKDWGGPIEGERPSAYIVMLHDTSLSKTIFWDHGIAATNILLGATEKGYGGVMVAAINKKELAKELDLDEKFEIVMVLAMGKPKEEIVLYEIEPGEDIKYWRDENQVHHVPKRKLKDIIAGVFEE